MRHIMLCATPRVGATVLMESLRGILEAEDVGNAYARIVSDDVEWRDWLPDTAILFAYEDMQHDVPAAARYIAKRLGFDGEPLTPTLRPFGSETKQTLLKDLS